MIKLIVTATLAFLIGALSFSILGNPPSEGKFAPYQEGLIASLLDRVEVLEKRFDEELLARQQLQRQLDQEHKLRNELAARVGELSGQNKTLLSASVQATDSSTTSFSLFNALRNSDTAQLLLDAGFSEEDADLIMELEFEMQQSLIQARFGASGNSPREILLNTQQRMRTELGDEPYEAYLETTGRPTSVAIRSVNEESAGAQAGLKNGDQIISYAGDRIFSSLELQSATQTGTPGQSVVVEVLRDGVPMTMVLPRGQIGISTAGFGRRNRSNNN